MGGDLNLVNGLISDSGRIAKQKAEENNWYDVSTLKEPYRVEGKKTMGLELAEDFDFELPDAIIYPTGGGTGIVGMWKAFDELEQLGLIESSKRPKMISVQSSSSFSAAGISARCRIKVNSAPPSGRLAARI